MNYSKYKKLFKLMFTEEVRLHTQLFSKNRLLAYPIVIASLLALAAYSATDILNIISIDIFILITHLLVFFFGAQTAAIAFKSQDMLENLVGEQTFMLYASTILPVSNKKLIGTFILKDILFYAGVFFLPISIALGLSTFNIALIPLLFVTITMLFTLGLTLTITLISFDFSSKYSLLGILSTLGLITVSIAQFNMISSYTYLSIVTIQSGTILLLSVVLFSILSILSFKTPSQTSSKTVITKKHFSNINPTKYIPFKEHVLAKKTHIDVLRSSGGIGKILFSNGILIGLAFILEQLLTQQIPQLQPYQTLLYTTILLMGSFTTYTWVYQADSEQTYTIYPISTENLINSKFIIFTLYTITSIIAIIGFTTLYYGTTPIQILLTILFSIGFTTFYYGVTCYYAGFHPSEFLFDSVRFTKFSAIIMSITLPALVYSLIGSLTVPSTTALLIGSILSAILFMIGLKLKNSKIRDSV